MIDGDAEVPQYIDEMPGWKDPISLCSLHCALRKVVLLKEAFSKLSRTSYHVIIELVWDQEQLTEISDSCYPVTSLLSGVSVSMCGETWMSLFGKNIRAERKVLVFKLWRRPWKVFALTV